MKAAVLEKIEDLKIKDVPVPKPGQAELIIKIKACAVCGTDVKVYHSGHKHIRFPRVTGHELSGEIVEIGKNITGYKTGQRVAIAPAVPCGECYYCRRGIQGMCDNLTAIGYHYDGGFAEYMLVPEQAVRNGCVNELPPNLSFEEGALAEPLACVINGQELSGVKLGDVVVVIGSGPIGCFHLELARSRGASKTILAEVSQERLDAARNFGKADIYINPGSEDLIARVMAETEGRGADVVIVACSSGKAQEQALQLVAKRGNINFFGGLPKDKPYINFDSNLVHYKEFHLVGTHGSAPRHNKIALNLISLGKIEAKKYITKELPLEKVLDGIMTVEKAQGLKTIIKP